MTFLRRPNSAYAGSSYYDASTKDYRIPQPDAYNKIKNDIFKTFSVHPNASYEEIKDLTKSSQKYSKRIDRICSKYCIKAPPKNSISTKIDSEYIAKKFIKNKSKQKQNNQKKLYMHQEISHQSHSARVSSKTYKTEQFFKITCQNLKKLQQKQKNENTKSRISKSKRKNSKFRYQQSEQSQIVQPNKVRQSHPYLKIYEQSQKEAFLLIMGNSNIDAKYEGIYPALQQAEQWQKYQKNIKDIYSGIKKMRYVHSARQRAKSSRSSFYAEKPSSNNQKDHDSFYIT